MAHFAQTEHCAIAFKEWAVVCEALGRGRQSIILRKGGIHEGREGFRVAHSKFWLLPTRFHASANALTASAAPLFEDAESSLVEGAFSIRYLAMVERVLELADEEETLALAGLHLWSEETVKQRFRYKQPGLFGLVVRMFVAPQSVSVADSPQIAGCRSWVELPEPLSTSGLSPVLDDASFQHAVDDIEARLLSTDHAVKRRS